MMKYWNNGKNKNPLVPIIPLFQFSIIPIVSEAK